MRDASLDHLLTYALKCTTPGVVTSSVSNALPFLDVVKQPALLLEYLSKKYNRAGDDTFSVEDLAQFEVSV